VIWQGTNVSEDHAASIVTLKMDAAWPPEMLVPYLITTCCHNPEDNDMKLFNNYFFTATLFSAMFLIGILRFFK
jgi:hypothetical protein